MAYEVMIHLIYSSSACPFEFIGFDPKTLQEGWCDSMGTLEDVKTKLQLRQEGAFKRERAIAYSLAQKVSKTLPSFFLVFFWYLCLFTLPRIFNFLSFQQWRSTPDSYSRTNSSLYSVKNQAFDKNCWGWSWLERWMAAKPWETRLMEQSHADSSETTPPLKNNSADSLVGKRSKPSEPSSVKVRKNNVTTRISAKPPHIGQATRSSSSPSSEFRYDESSASSSICTSTTPVSGNTMLASDRTDDSSNSRPNYMNLTESTKAKQKVYSYPSHRIQRQSMDEFQFLKRSAVFSNGDSKSTAGSDTLYIPTHLEKNSMKLR